MIATAVASAGAPANGITDGCAAASARPATAPGAEEYTPCALGDEDDTKYPCTSTAVAIVVLARMLRCVFDPVSATRTGMTASAPERSTVTGAVRHESVIDASPHTHSVVRASTDPTLTVTHAEPAPAGTVPSEAVIVVSARRVVAATTREAGCAA